MCLPSYFYLSHRRTKHTSCTHKCTCEHKSSTYTHARRVPAQTFKQCLSSPKDGKKITGSPPVSAVTFTRERAHIRVGRRHSYTCRRKHARVAQEQTGEREREKEALVSAAKPYQSEAAISNTLAVVYVERSKLWLDELWPSFPCCPKESSARH